MSTRDSGEYALFNLRLSVGTLDRIQRYRKRFHERQEGEALVEGRWVDRVFEDVHRLLRQGRSRRPSLRP
jgi:hypothetical protein